MNKLELDSVNLSFSGRTILSSIYLKCETGDVIGMVGRNGSGKSSLMKILFGTLKAESQSIRLNGQYASPLLKVPQAVQFLPQDGFAMNYLSFNDLIAIYNLKDDMDRILEIEEIRKNMLEKLGTLSGGVKDLWKLSLFSTPMLLLLSWMSLSPFYHRFWSKKWLNILNINLRKKGSYSLIISMKPYLTLVISSTCCQMEQ